MFVEVVSDLLPYMKRSMTAASVINLGMSALVTELYSVTALMCIRSVPHASNSTHYAQLGWPDVCPHYQGVLALQMCDAQ